MIANSIVELIGNTPLLEVSNYSKKNALKGRLVVKLESFNPLSSVKDRIGYAMIRDGIEKGLIKKDTLLIEATSGNTGIALAFVATSMGYNLTLTMPETMSIERRNLLKALGANLVLTDGALGMNGAINKAKEIAKENPDSYILSQFDNISNPEIHKETTGKEIWNDTEGKIDIFVSGIGTGGTITGVGEYLKSKNPNIKIIGVEPEDSPVLSGGKPGPHRIQGIGAGFKPNVLNLDIVDEIYKVKNEDAFSASKELAKTEGILVGISSGAAAFAGSQIALLPENEGKLIVALLPDTGERYLSTDLF